MQVPAKCWPPRSLSFQAYCYSPAISKPCCGPWPLSSSASSFSDITIGETGHTKGQCIAVPRWYNGWWTREWESKRNIAPGETYIDLDCSWGGVELHIPADWQVRIECSCFCGGCEDKRWQGTPAKQAFLPPSCSVFLPGQLSFCGIICRLWQTLHYKQKNSPPPRQKRPLPCHKKKVLTGSR